MGSWAADGNASLLIIAKILGHRQTSTTERYAKPFEDPVRAVAETTGAALEAAMEGKAAQVVEMKPRGSR